MPFRRHYPGAGPARPERFRSPQSTVTAARLVANTDFTGPVVLANPNWPATGFEIDFTSGPPSTAAANRMSIDCPARRLTVRGWSVDNRGRNYELDQCQAGTMTVGIVDPLELLNPDNVGSPFNTGGNSIIPYRGMWAWAIWPNQPGTGNIINPGVPFLSGVYGVYDSSFETGLGLWASTSFDTTVTQATTQRYHNTHSMRVDQSFVGAGDGVNNRFPTIPGLTYTFSAYVYPTGGCAVNAQVTDAAGNTHSASVSVQNKWTRLAVTWNCVDTLETVTVYSSISAVATYFVDATQLEFGDTPTGFTTTGPVVESIFNGYVERYPTTYDMAGTRAVRPLVAVDALAILSRTIITQSYAATVAADNPVLRIHCDESAPPGRVVTPEIPPGIITECVQAAGPGGDISWGGDTFPDGTRAVVLSQQVQDPVSTPYAAQNVKLDIPNNNTYQIDTAGATLEFWARPTNGAANFGLFGANSSGDYMFPFNSLANVFFGIIYTQQGFAFRIQDDAYGFYLNASASGSFNPDGTNFGDNNWHYYTICLFAQAGNPALYDVGVRVDGFEQAYSVGNNVKTIGANQLTSAVTTAYGQPQSTLSLANIAAYPVDIGSTARHLHYQRGAGYPGELSGARVTRILDTYWQGVSTVAAGTLAMAADHSYNGRTVLEVIQEIQESERGLFYADRNGTPVFEDRNTRYLSDTSQWTFGENPAGTTEYPYVEYNADYDPTYVFTQVNLSRPGNTAYPPAVNSAAQALYGQRVLSQEVQCLTDFDLDQAAIFYQHRYGTPRTRLATLTLDPAANPALWRVVLGMEISQRVTVARRVGDLTVQADYYIEKITHRVSPGEWKTGLQLSPVFVPRSWVLGDTARGVLGVTSIPVY